MKKLLLHGILCLLFSVSAYAMVTEKGEKTTKVTHLVLIDNSGTMTKWFLNDPIFINQLTQNFLLSSQIFRDGDEIIIRSFNDAYGINQSPNYREQDPDRVCVLVENKNGESLNSSTRRELLQEFSQKLKHTWKDTDLKEAIDLAILDIHRFIREDKVIIIWLLSDNRQDLGPSDPNKEDEKLEIKAFYQFLYESEVIKRSYFFPIIRDLNNPNRNLVCYAILYQEGGKNFSGKEIEQATSRIQAAGTALAVMTNGKYSFIPAILCKPTEKEPFILDPEMSFQPEDEKIKGASEGNKFVFSGLREGEGFSGKLNLFFRSRFKYWRIENANLEDPVLTIESSADQTLEIPEASICKIYPREITVGPGERTKKGYELSLQSGTDPLFVPKVKGFPLKTFLPGAKESLNGKFGFKIMTHVNANKKLILEGMDKEIEKVRMLSNIEDFMFLQRMEPSKPEENKFTYPVMFEVGFASWRVVSFFAFIICVLVMTSIILILVLSKIEGQWVTAEGSRNFTLHFLRKEGIKFKQQDLGNLSYFPGRGVRFAVKPPSRLVGGANASQLKPGENLIDVYVKDIKYKLKIFIKPKITKPEKKPRGTKY